MRFQWQEQSWYNHTLEQTDAITFTKAYHFRLYPHYYNYFRGFLGRVGSHALPREVTLRNEVTHFGRSSSIWDIKAVDESRAGDILLQVEVMFLTADLKTRKPRDCTHRLGMPPGELPRLPNPMRPLVTPRPTTPCHTEYVDIEVGWIDENRHTNWKPYFWMCLSAVYEANRGRYHHHYGNDIRDTPITDLELVFHRESNLGDRLKVVTWDDPARSGVIHVHVIRDEELVTHCKITYGTPGGDTSIPAKL